MQPQLAKQMKAHSLLLVEVGDRVEVRKGDRVLSFHTNADAAVKKALERIEADRIRNLRDDTEPVLQIPKRGVNGTKALEQAVMAMTVTEVPTLAPEDIAKSVVKAHYREKYKANGFNCGDIVADELKEYCNKLRGSRLVVDLERLKEVALENGVWDERYAALNAGLARMTIGNRLRAKIEAGDRVLIGGVPIEKKFD